MTEQKITYPEAAGEVTYPDDSRLTVRILPQPEPCRCGKSGEHYPEVILNSLGEQRRAAGLSAEELDRVEATPIERGADDEHA